MVDDQGAFAFAQRKPKVFRTLLTGSRPCPYSKKDIPKGYVFSLVDDQGLETDLRGQKWGFFKEKTAKIARFESHAPIMPQNAPV
ncbi:MAG: hypothetical protein J6A46_01235 [Clostridia bacterium]|nr:hypothetical protein [Clostridia bacterium]